MKLQQIDRTYWAFIFITLFLFLAHQVLERYFEINISLLDNYLDPFCLGVLATFIFSLEHRWRFPRRKLTLLEVIILITVLSLISELLFPYLSDKFVGDWWDGVAIAVGGLGSYYLGE